MNLNYELRHELRRRKIGAKALAEATGWTLNRANVFFCQSPDMKLSTVEKVAAAIGMDVRLVPRNDENQD